MIRLDKRYKKDDTTYLFIHSWKADKKDFSLYGAKKRVYMMYYGNDVAGWWFCGRYFTLSKARKAMRTNLAQ